MRRILLFFILTSFYSEAYFSGHWVNESNSQSLTLDLIEDGAHIIGSYCFITNSGNRIDCSEGNDKNIDGVVKDSIGVVSFASTFGNIGEATLLIEKDTLIYTITNYTPFISANMSVPKIIYFKREEKNTDKKSSAHGGCKINEKLIASCNLPGSEQQVAMFCIDNNNAVRYYFKKADSIELEVSFNEKNTLKRWLDLRSYTTYLGFNKGAYSYILGVPKGSPGVVAFLNVKKNGKTISSKNCDSNSLGDKNIKNNSIEDVLDASVKNNGFKFP